MTKNNGRDITKIPERFQESMLNIWKNWDRLTMTEEKFLSAYPEDDG